MLQILTSDFDSCPADILAWLKSRWREENFLKYASENYGIDKICDYIAGIEDQHQDRGQPGPQEGQRRRPQGSKGSGRRRAGPSYLLADPAISPAAKNTRLIPAAQDKIAAAHKKLAAAEAARDQIPAKLPANIIDPAAQVALQRTCRRGLQMVLRLHAHNAEHWLANHLNAYLHDDDEYRAITRQTIIRGLAGTITYTPRPDHRRTPQARRPPRRPRPGPAHRRDQPHPARHARRHQAHHLPAHRTPARIKQITQNDYRRSGSAVSSLTLMPPICGITL